MKCSLAQPMPFVFILSVASIHFATAALSAPPTPSAPNTNHSVSGKVASSNYSLLLKPLDIYAPPANAKRLISLMELYTLVSTKGASLKVARESYNATKQTVKTDQDKKLPVISMDLGHSQKWSKTKGDSDPTDDYADREQVSGARSASANGGFSLTGSPVQGLSYKLIFPQLAHSQEFPDTNNQNPRRPDSGAFSASIDMSLLQNNPFLVEPINKRKTNLTLTVAKETLKQQVITKIAEAQTSFFGLAQKYLQLTVQERSLKLALALEQDVKEKIRAGESSSLEATRSELQTAQSETDYMSAQIDYENAVEEFRRSLSFDEKDGQGIFPDPKALDANVENFKVPDNALNEIKKSNPDIILAQLAKQGVELDLDLARKGTLPSLSFSTSYGNNAPGENPRMAAIEAARPNDRTFSMSLNFSKVLYNDTTKNALQQAILAKQKADFAIDETERKIFKDYNALIKKLEIGGRRHKIAKISREIAEKKLQSEYEKFRVGESSVRNVIDTQTEVNGARISEISARVEMLLGYAQLNALQGKLPEGVSMATGS